MFLTSDFFILKYAYKIQNSIIHHLKYIGTHSNKFKCIIFNFINLLFVYIITFYKSL